MSATTTLENTMTEYTPWAIDIEVNHLRVSGRTQGGHRIGIADICINRLIEDSGPSKTEQANARLIAAAPELLQNLQRILAEWDASEGGRTTSCLVIDETRAAIVKATS